MKILLALFLCATQVVVSSEYPKQITLTVTKVTRERKPSSGCDTCGFVVTVEAHNATASFILVCKSYWVPSRPKNNSACAQFGTGMHEAKMLAADLISFWPERSASEPWENREDYSVVVEEARTRECN